MTIPELDLREQIARIDRALAQAEESRKLLPGRLARVEAEIERRHQEIRLAPWQLAIGGTGAGAALFAVAFAFAKLW